MTASILSSAAAASAASAGAASSGAVSSGAVTQAGTTALSGLASNFTNFLSLLMTQLKSQDPSSPMDSNQFTSQLVQFTSVEQQISTNSNLTQLIQLSQANQVEQSASLIGKPVTVASTQLSLQKGTAQVNFDTKASEPVGIAIYNTAGAQVQTATLTSTAGTNSWKWNGENANGSALPDGPYKVSVVALGVNGAKAAVPFTVTGTATSVLNNSGTVQVQMGGLTLPFSAVQSVGQ